VCSRFRQTTWSHDWKAFYGVDDDPDFTPGYNIAPTDRAGVVRADKEGERVLVGMRWGLIPSWAKDRCRRRLAACASRNSSEGCGQ
jgi:putative SOS response-associated peptidase YedK